MKLKEYPAIGERVYMQTLPNGLRIRVIPRPGFKTQYAAFATAYGGAHRRFCVDGKMLDTPAGIAHFLEHKMFDMPEGENALAQLSENGADPNAFTSPSETCYYFQCTESFEENLRLLLKFVSTPYFTDETVEKEQGIIGQEILMGQDNPALKLYYSLLNMLYSHHPIKDRVAGTVESIAQIDAKTLYDCHRMFYCPANMVLCVVGDVDADTVERLAREILPEEKQDVIMADFGEKEELLPNMPLLRQKLEVAAPQFLIGAKLDISGDRYNDMRYRLLADLSLKLLCGSSSALYTRLYESGMINHSFEYESCFLADTAYIVLGGESKDAELVRAELLKEIAQVCENGFEKGSFIRSKRSAIGSRLRQLEDFDGLCTQTAMSLLEGFEEMEAMDMLESISLEDCRSFVEMNLKPERLAISIIEPKERESE